MTSARKSAPAAKKAKAARKPISKPAAKRPPAKKPAAKKAAKPTKRSRSSAVEHSPEAAKSVHRQAVGRGEDAGSTPAAGTTPAKRDLTEKEALFVKQYLVDMNATQAYMRSHPGVKVTSASTNGTRLLGNAWIQAAIAEARAKTMGKLELSLERILLEATRLALFDPRKLFAEDGRPLNVTELDDDTAAAIAGLEVLEEYEGSGQDRVLIGHVKKYKVADKNSALEKLMKHLGAFEKDNRQKGASLADAFRAFLGQLHGTSGGRLAPVRREGAPGNALTPKGGEA